MISNIISLLCLSKISDILERIIVWDFSKEKVVWHRCKWCVLYKNNISLNQSPYLLANSSNFFFKRYNNSNKFVYILK